VGRGTRDETTTRQARSGTKVTSGINREGKKSETQRTRLNGAQAVMGGQLAKAPFFKKRGSSQTRSKRKEKKVDKIGALPPKSKKKADLQKRDEKNGRDKNQLSESFPRGAASREKKTSLQGGGKVPTGTRQRSTTGGCIKKFEKVRTQAGKTPRNPARMACVKEEGGGSPVPPDRPGTRRGGKGLTNG